MRSLVLLDFTSPGERNCVYNILRIYATHNTSVYASSGKYVRSLSAAELNNVLSAQRILLRKWDKPSPTRSRVPPFPLSFSTRVFPTSVTTVADVADKRAGGITSLYARLRARL